MLWEPTVLSQDPEKIKELLFLEGDEWEKIKDKKFTFTLKRINRLQKAELDEEFFKKVIPQLVPEAKENEENPEEPLETEISLEDFKQELAKLLKEEWDKELDNSLNYRIRDQLLKIHEIPLPDEFLKKLQEGEQKQKPTSDEDRENAYKQYATGMRWTLIVDTIRDENPEIDISEEELKESILNMYRMYNPNMSKEEELNILASLLQNPELVNNQTSRLMEEKVFSFLRDQVETIETPITVTDFMEKQEREAAEEEAADKEKLNDKEDTADKEEAAAEEISDKS